VGFDGEGEILGEVFLVVTVKCCDVVAACHWIGVRRFRRF
jgi:hypothetical protein